METIQRKNRKKHLRKKTEIIENGNGEKKITIYKWMHGTVNRMEKKEIKWQTDN